MYRNFKFNFFQLYGLRYLSSKSNRNYDVKNERLSVEAMDTEYRKFLEKKQKENIIPQFKITNIDINTYKQYKHKNNPIFSNEFKVFITGFLILSWIIFAMYLTVRILTPDDFEWIENERKRLEDAKKKIMIIKEKEINDIKNN